MKNVILFFFFLITLHCQPLMSQSTKDTLITRWERKIASQLSNNYVVMDFDIDSENNILIASYTNETSSHLENYFIAKLDQEGNIVWQKTYGSNNSRAKFIKADSLRNIYVTGYTTNAESVTYLTTIKLDVSGNILWSKNYTNSNGSADTPNDMILDKDANIYITGESYDSSSNSKIITIKYSSAGDLIWHNEYDANKMGDDKGFMVKVDSNKNVYVLGTTTNNIPNMNVVLIKYNKDGTQQWCNIYNDPYNNDYPVGFEISFDSVFMLLRSGSGLIITSKLFMVDSLGFNKWSNSFITSYGSSYCITSGIYGIYLGGYDTGMHQHFAFFKVYNYLGESQFSSNYSVGDNNHPYDYSELFKIFLDSNNYCYLLLKRGLSSNTQTLNTYQLRMLDDKFNLLASIDNVPGINTNISPCNIKMDQKTNITIASNGTSGTNNFILLSQYRRSTITGISKNIPVNFSLSQNYPNPFNPSTTINYSIASAGNVTLKVYDMLGREVATLVNEFKQPGNYQVNFNASHVERSRDIPSGVYFYRLQCGSFSQTKKLILMK